MANARGRASDREVTRDRILDAAEQVFAERGFHETTLEDIAAAAGFTRGALYSNFASKEDIFFALFDRQGATEVAGIERALSDAAESGQIVLEDPFPPAERRDNTLLRLDFLLYCARRPELRDRVTEGPHRSEPYARSITALAEAMGVELPIPAVDIAEIVVAMVNGLALLELFEPDEETRRRERLFGALVKVITQAAGGAPNVQVSTS